MTQLVGHRGHVVSAALVIEQHPGGELGRDRSAEGAAALALAHFAIEMAIIEDALGHCGRIGDRIG